MGYSSKPYHPLVHKSSTNSVGTHAVRLPIDGTKTSYDRLLDISMPERIPY